MNLIFLLSDVLWMAEVGSLFTVGSGSQAAVLMGALESAFIVHLEMSASEESMSLWNA